MGEEESHLSEEHMSFVAHPETGSPLEEQGERGLTTPYNWQEELDYFLKRDGYAPDGKEYPDYMLSRLTNAQHRAKRAGDEQALARLEGLEELFVATAFPFLSEPNQRAYTRMYYKAGGYLTPTEQENELRLVLPVTNGDYAYLTRLLDKANITELYRLSGRGEVPLKKSPKFGHAVPILPRNTEMRRIASKLGLQVQKG